MIPLAVVTGASPFGLIALFLVIDTPRPGANGAAFLAGWLLALATALILAATLLGGEVRTDTAPGTVVLAVQGYIGGVLLLLGLRMFRPANTAGGDLGTESTIFDRLRGLSPWSSAVAGALVPAHPAALVAGSVLVRSGAPRSTLVWGAVTFLVISTAIPAIPVAAITLSPSARVRVDGARTWLVVHRRRVGAILLALTGAYVAFGAISELVAR